MNEYDFSQEEWELLGAIAASPIRSLSRISTAITGPFLRAGAGRSFPPDPGEYTVESVEQFKKHARRYLRAVDSLVTQGILLDEAGQYSPTCKGDELLDAISSGEATQRAVPSSVTTRLLSHPADIGAAVKEEHHFLLWKEVDESCMKLGDHQGVLTEIKKGSVAWAVVEILIRHRHQVILIQEFAGKIDLVLSEWDRRAEDQARSRPGAASDHDAQLMDVAQRSFATKPRSRPTYSGRESLETIKAIQAVLRDTIGSGERASDWRRRWIHWDRRNETVLLEYRS